jgi:hypothetical protein
MTVPAELHGTKGDRLAARVAVPFVATLVYGTYNLVTLGASSDHYLYTYIPLLGGIAAIAGLLTYYLVVVTGHGQRSWKNGLVLLGFLPYFFSLYIIGFLGVYSMYRGIVGAFSIWSILAGLFWIVVGYRGLNQYYLMTEIVRRHDEAAKFAR